MRQVKTKPITLSMPEEVIYRMHKRLGRGQMSSFTVKALEKALDELEANNEQELEKAYEAASQDKERESEAKEWDGVDNWDNLEDEDWRWLNG